MTSRNLIKTYNLRNYTTIPQIQTHLSPEQQFAIEVVGSVLPFKVNNYVVDELIDWNNAPDDPLFALVFPQKNMLKPEHFALMADAILLNKPEAEKMAVANKIRAQLNPHPAGQTTYNVPTLNGVKLTGLQHKYRETLLFFPEQGQNCHAHCTFCFRWPQFINEDSMRFASRETELLTAYLKAHPEITDILITGGDPLSMPIKHLRNYIEPLLHDDLAHVQTIRIGTKTLSYWPYRYLTQADSDEVLQLFEEVAKKGRTLAFMAHFNHPHELQTEAVQKAIQRIRSTGAIIRTQSPIMKHINDKPEIWRDMWKEQVRQGLIPYYMFVARDTGAQHFFALPLERTWEVFREAYQQVSGIARTVRGPSMSATPGKVQILGVSQIHDEKVFVLRFLQGRNPDWIHRPFFAKYDPTAIWLDDLKPAFGGDKFFFEEEHEQIVNKIPKSQTVNENVLI